MRGSTRRALTARAYLARLAVVVRVLAGLVLANGMQCTDGMTAMALRAGDRPHTFQVQGMHCGSCTLLIDDGAMDPGVLPPAVVVAARGAR